MAGNVGGGGLGTLVITLVASVMRLNYVDYSDRNHYINAKCSNAG
jgi:hypothetical protein